MVRPFQKRKKRKKEEKIFPQEHTRHAHTWFPFEISTFHVPLAPIPFLSFFYHLRFVISLGAIVCTQWSNWEKEISRIGLDFFFLYSSFVRFIFASPPSSKYGQSLFFFFFWLNALVGHWSLVWIVNFFCWCVWIINLSKSQNVSKSVGFCCLMLNIIYNHAKLFWLWFHSFAKFLCSIFVQ